MSSQLSPVFDLEIEPTIQNLATSQQVFGRYTLREVLGRGGMGIVWLAFDERLERKVALKFLPETVNFDPSALDDLKRETRRCLELTHPNIVRIHDFIKDAQSAAISMEYIDGKTLAACRIDQEKRFFEVGAIKSWILQACQALQYAHSEVGVVHRDLKPANLMLSSRGQIKVADFGISRSVSDSMRQLTIRRGTSGTLVYMSPQQMNGDLPRVTDDIYALGATIYEFLTSKPPFYSGDIPYQGRLSVPPSMARRRSELGLSGDDIPQEWEETVAACLAKLPEDRPATMNELAERLGLSPMTERIAPTVRITPAPAKRAKWTLPKFKLPRFPLPLPPTKPTLWAAGSVMAFIAVGAVAWQWVIWPFLATPGEVVLTSNPPGATVHLAGRPDQTTPATFSSLRIGQYRMEVSKDGFDPKIETVAITPGMKIDLGTIQLARSYGNLDLTTVPRHGHYLLIKLDDGETFQKEGETPETLSDLPAGAYQLTLTETGFPPCAKTVEIPSHGTATEEVDFVLLAAAERASPGPAKVLRGEMDASQLSVPEKAELSSLLKNSFQEYLSHGLLAPAAKELTDLQKLGASTDMEAKQLADKGLAAEKEYSREIDRLIRDGKPATAAEKLKNLDGVLESESVGRLQAEFGPALDPYQRQIDAVIADGQQEPPAAGYERLKESVTAHSDDLNLQLALAKLLMRLPPEHDLLAARLRALRQFGVDNADFAGELPLSAMERAVADELNQLDALSQALADAKNGVSGATRLAGLKAQKADLQRIRVGAPRSNVFTKTWNFLGKAVTGHSVVETESYFSSEEQKEDAIAAIDDQIDREQRSLALPPSSTVAEAQKRYDDFVAQVPWGPQ
jgi:serine/threonine protein kinase